MTHVLMLLWGLACTMFAADIGGIFNHRRLHRDLQRAADRVGPGLKWPCPRCGRTVKPAVSALLTRL